MNWQSITTAPTDCYCLGYDPHLTRAFVMKWNAAKRKFVVLNGFGDETPTHWLALPLQAQDWNPLETAPKDTYCLGYDLRLKRPFVMLWNVCDEEFVPACGLGDETAGRWLPLPPVPTVAELSAQPVSSGAQELSAVC
jgi:hypothetical protein